MSFRPPLFLALLAGLLLPRCAQADWITMRDGRRQQCVITESNASYLRLERPAGIISLPMSEITKVDRESPADDAVLHAQYAFDPRTSDPQVLQQALAAYAAALQQGASGANLCASLQDILDAISAPSAHPPTPVRDALANLLAALAGPASDGAPEEFLIEGSQFLMQAGRSDAALLLFEKIPAATRQAHPQWRKSLIQAMAGDIRALMAQGQTDAAIQRVLALARLDPSLNQQGQVWAALAKADALRQAGRFDEAIKVYATETAADYPELSKSRASAAIRQALSGANQSGNFQAVVALTTNETLKLLGQDITRRLRAEIYRQWGLYLLQKNQFDPAREAFKQYYIYAPADKQPLMDLITYHEKAAQLAPDDIESHYDLAVFCRQSGLLDEAAAEFQLVLKDPQWGALAQKQLDDLRDLQLQSTLDAALQLKDAGHFEEARRKVADVLSQTTDAQLRQLAQRSQDVILQSMKLQENKAPAEAEVIMQNAERCILPQEAQRCLELCDQVLRQYPDTPAAKRAAQRRNYLLERGMKDTGLAEATPGAASQPASAPAAAGVDENGIDRQRLEDELNRLRSALETAGTQ